MAPKRWLHAGIAVLIAATGAACNLPTDSSTDTTNPFEEVPDGCVVVDITLSPEKIDLISELARDFNGSDEAEIDGDLRVRPPAAQILRRGGAGAGAGLERGRRRTESGGVVAGREHLGGGAEPALGGQGRAADGHGGRAVHAHASGDRHARADGRRARVPADTDRLLRHPRAGAEPARAGARSAIPEWGPFRLGKTNPNFSTSGLAALIAQAYAATGKTENLSSEDLAKPEVIDFATGVESAVVHYGDTTLTFLNNWYRADQRGTSLTYVSAAAVEEKSVIDYNAGTPTACSTPARSRARRRSPWWPSIPKKGTLFSDNPYIVLDAPWVNSEEAEAARVFEDFIKRPENQRKVLEFGFRPGNPEVASGAPIVEANGVDPDEPQTLLEVPDPPVMTELLDRWEDQRKRARVMLVLDVSGSMGDPAGDDTFESKLDLAKQAAIDAIDLFGDDDEVALRIFSTELGDSADQNFLDLVGYGRIGDQGERIKTTIRGLVPTNGTPLYTVTQSSYETARRAYDRGPHQRGRAAHRRHERRRQHVRRRPAARPADRHPASRQRGAGQPAGARVHDRVRLGCRHRSTPTDRRGKQRRGLRRQRSRVDQQRPGRGGQQLLALTVSPHPQPPNSRRILYRSVEIPSRVRRSVPQVAPRRSFRDRFFTPRVAGPSHHRSGSFSRAPARPSASSSACRSRVPSPSEGWRGPRGSRSRCRATPGPTPSIRSPWVNRGAGSCPMHSRRRTSSTRRCSERTRDRCATG